MSLAADIVEYLTGERRAMKPDDLAAAIQRDAIHNSAWPKAPFTAWQAAIQDAIKTGQLIEDGDRVRIAPPFVAMSRLFNLGRSRPSELDLLEDWGEIIVVGSNQLRAKQLVDCLDVARARFLRFESALVH